MSEATQPSDAGSAPLPYDGDINKAMGAQDRDAIRTILAARGAAAAASHGAGVADQGADSCAERYGLSAEQFQCAICCELLHKPCVASCGHPFCFWCLHLAMSPLAPSACPLCRNPFAHFASICRPLHYAVARLFPQEHEKRCTAVSAEEKNKEMESPDIPATSLVDFATGLISDLTCAACGKLAATPAVLNCGHIVCGRGGCIPAREGVACPECRVPVPVRPRVCPLLEASISAAAPAIYEERCAACDEATAAASEAATTAADQLELCPGSRVELRSLQSAPELNGQIGTLETFEESSGRWFVRLADGQVKSLKPANLLAVATENAEEAVAAENAENAENAEEAAAKNFVHFGRGCDNCGAYPIIGACWHCCDCPEKIGYDLCGACKNSGRPPATGRFNQHHLPEHRLEEVRQERTVLHDIQDARPDLTIQQIIEFVEMMRAAEPGEESP
eukprot:gnl/TRDRNA2_/TRDRNA2_45064_c0_seq1.p1 gnl/TRDRNA2_/TRDRNA2_45064_c0~~gnl/TRDRNA2_/TRDRNA2_45064_c0_seq1.p1  ORF type:complete len:468 (-),score=87.63 gnl/TRDRNA2_/TRDRNA2_45064_c0_seq1:89-1441(-)